MDRRHKRGYEGKIAGLYDIEETIGTGHFAVVKLARHVFTGEKVAVKVIDKTKLDEISKSHLFQEVRCMKLVQHPHVVRLYEVIDTQTKLYLILELGDGGDMYDYIMKHDKGLEEHYARRYFKQIVTAISYCHELHVVHRDLKPENVVFFPKLGVVKLTDFGFSNKFVPGMKLETSCGSLAYSAPEILLGDSYDAPAVDVWSLGVLLFMLVTGEPPFQEANDSETLTMILDCKYKMPQHVSDELKDLIANMLRREPGDRIRLENIINHPWLQYPVGAESCHRALISREHLSDSDHDLIIDRMADGNIASKDEILRSLEENSYNHITATYYLLAERRLKKYHDQLAASQTQLRHVRQNSAPVSGKPSLSPLVLSPRIQPRTETEESPFSKSLKSLVSPVTHLPPKPIELESPNTDSVESPGFYNPTPTQSAPHRKCSLIHEESEDSSASESKDLDIDMEDMTHEIRMTKSTEDAVASGSHLDVDRSMGSLSIRRSNTTRPLRTVSSSPQLVSLQFLNQICEEGESDDEEDDMLGAKSNLNRCIHSRNSVASPEMLRKFQNRKKRLSGSKSRTGASCSSSDASDTDETDTRKRKQKLKTFPRRDSSDHSSDTDGPGRSNGSGPGGGRSFGGGGGSQGGRDRKDRDQDDDRNEGTKRRKSGNNNSKGKQQSYNVLDTITAAIKSLKPCPVKSEKDKKPSELEDLQTSSKCSVSKASLSSGNSRGDKCVLESRKISSHVLEKRIAELNEENIIKTKFKEFSPITEGKILEENMSYCKKECRIYCICKCGADVKRKSLKEKNVIDLNYNSEIAHSSSIVSSKCSN